MIKTRGRPVGVVSKKLPDGTFYKLVAVGGKTFLIRVVSEVLYQRILDPVREATRLRAALGKSDKTKEVCEWLIWVAEMP